MEEPAQIDLDVLVEQAHDLDPLPHTVVELCRLIASPDADIDEIEKTVTGDPVLVGNILGLANSVLVAGNSEITQVREAVMRLGTGVILSVALGASVRGRVSTAIPEYGLSEGELWKQSALAAFAVELMPSHLRRRPPPESGTTALISGIGKIVMARHLKPELLTLLATARAEGHQSELIAEREVLGVDHCELSGIIIQSWGLPDSMRKALTWQGRPDEVESAVCDTVHIALRAVARVEDPENAPMPDPNALERLGASPDSFLALCSELDERKAEAAARYGCD